jgi:type VI secretion system ImpM family protein
VLASLFSKKSVRPRKTGCLGKLPCHGDFLRHNAVHEELRWLDEWVRNGMVASYSRMGPAWARAFDAAPPARIFAFRPETGRILCVRFKPARDSVGRRYPFLMFHLENPAADEAGMAPLVPALEPFFGRARDVADHGGTGSARGEFLRHVEALNRAGLPLFEPHRFDEWLENRRSGGLFRRIFGREDDPGRYALVRNVVEAASDPRAATAVLRLPATARAGDVAFWTALIERRTRARGIPMTLLWSRPLDGGPRPPAILLGDPAPHHFNLFIEPGYTEPSITDLHPAAEPDPRALTRLQRRFGHLLEDPDLPLRILLDYLGMLDLHAPPAAFEPLARVA